MCSPLRRGWSPLPGGVVACGYVLPAQAGVVPKRVDAKWLTMRCSPLRRGWSLAPMRQIPTKAVLPAQAGVVPLGMTEHGAIKGAPRSGGGGP